MPCVEEKIHLDSRVRRNVGGADACLRCLVGVGVLVVALVTTALPAFSFVSLVAAIGLLATGVTRRCPFYEWLGGRPPAP